MIGDKRQLMKFRLNEIKMHSLLKRFIFRLAETICKNPNIQS